MNRRPPIPFSILRELRCRNCQNVVSCGPVFVVPDGSIICGRCQELAKNMYRNISFEALASMFLYPCRNWEDHCPAILHWNDCYKHENGCSYTNGCGLFWKHPRAYLKGKREMPVGDIRLIPVPERLLDQIKCTQCESYLSCEPVFLQTDGKNICHRCIHSNGVPADCVRNSAYEILSNIIIFPCVFRNRGCPTRLKFGTDLWHHEAECSYNQMYKKAEKIPKQKEKGVIKTHSGHYYGTITPYSAPFAPPSPTTEFDINKELVKSLKKQQERKLLKAEDINTNIMKMSSDSGSRDDSVTPSSDGDSDKGTYDKSLSSRSSTPTPTRSDELDSKPQTPYSPESLKDQPYFNYNYIKQTTPTYWESSRDQPQFNFNLKQNGNNNYYDNIQLAQIQQESSINPREERLSKTNSYIYEPVLYKGQKSPLQDLDYNLLAGHYPVFVNPYGQGLIPKPSFKGLVRTDSLSSNRELIEELRQKQIKLKNRNSEKTEVVDSNPYKECNNLEEILQVHDKISE